jgi:hypothetical protein
MLAIRDEALLWKFDALPQRGAGTLCQFQLAGQSFCQEILTKFMRNRRRIERKSLSTRPMTGNPGPTVEGSAPPAPNR